MIVSFTEYVLWIVRMYAAAEMSMNSVERVSECKSQIPPMVRNADDRPRLGCRRGRSG
jgi:hypothetical protein